MYAVHDEEQMDWRYLAGLFDGEGNITIISNPKTHSRGISVMVLSQSEGNGGKELSDAVAVFLRGNHMLGTHVYVMKAGTDKRGVTRQTCYTLRIGNKWDARMFFDHLRPFCVIKKPQIERALEFIKTLRNHTRPFTEQEQNLILKLHNEKKSQKVIAQRIGCGASKIYRFLKVSKP